jgi:hypothetical protein
MTCMIVLGVPRSGTSLVAGLLHQMGVFMGQKLMAPMEGVNPLGFFEDEEFLERHIWMLRSEDEPSLAFNDTLKPDQRMQNEYRQLVRRREEEHEIWGIKDPRMCFTLPYFLDCLQNDFRLITTHRAFHVSANSLAKLPGYQGMPLDRVVGVMGRYHYMFEKSCLLAKSKLDSPMHHLHIRYDFLVSDPDLYVNQIAELTGLSVPEEERKRLAREFVDPKLNHA